MPDISPRDLVDFLRQGDLRFRSAILELPPDLLGDLPIKRIHIINNRVAWGSVSGATLFVTFSACEIKYIWRWDMLPSELRDQTRSDLGRFPETLFQSATYDPSTGIRVSLNPNWFKNQQKITVARNHRSPWEVILDDKGIDQETVPKK